MNSTLAAFAERSRYRPASIAIILAWHLAIAGVFLGIPDWLCFLVAAPLAIILTVMTYHRLRNGAFSGAWVWLMVAPLGVGPTWYLSDHLTLNLGGGIVALLPVTVAWFIPTASERVLRHQARQ